MAHGLHQAKPALTQAVRARAPPSVRSAKGARSRGAVRSWNEERDSSKAIKPALRQPMRVTELPVADVMSAGSLLGEGTPSSWVKEREAVGNMSEAAMDEELSRLEALARQVQALGQSQAAAVQELDATIDGLMSDSKELAEGIEQHIKDGRVHRLVMHGDQAALRLQALQEDGRLRALAHVGITEYAIAADNMPVGDRITGLVQQWGKTCCEWLSEDAFMEISRCFGSEFMSFIEKDALIMDMPYAMRPTYTLSIDMPPAEKAYIMEAIDYLLPEAKREGGRRAFLAFMGCSAYIGSSAYWERELRRVEDALAALGCGSM